MEGLRRLDALLTAAVARAQDALGPPRPFPGLYVDTEQVARLLARDPLHATGVRKDGPHPLAALGDVLGLDGFDLDVVLLALAPELDLRYERLFAYLQDDMARWRPTVGLALDLLCGSTAEKLDRRARFAADAPLLRGRVLERDAGSLLRRPLVLDDQVVRLATGGAGLDARLSGLAELAWPARPFASVPQPEGVRNGVARLSATGLPLVLVGPPGLGQRELAEAIAASTRKPLLHVRAGAEPAVAAREALIHGAVLLIDEPEDVEPLRDSGAHVVVSARERPAGFVAVPLAAAGVDVRRACWESELGDDPQLAWTLATRFRMTPAQIHAAAEAARHDAVWAEATESPASVFAAARGQTADDLAGVARKLDVGRAGWDDLVLPPGAVAQLRELRDRVLTRDRVGDEWGFARRHGARGVTALFAGASGTGKTTAASVLAAAAEYDLFCINLATIVDKYIGETEKNLDRVFAAAENANVVLLFDEAEALFGKRSEVRDAHDRYANIEIAYLLQRMEAFDGVSILATNLQRNLDEAFTRRLDVIVHFPFPEVAERRAIWERIWPAEAPVDPSIDFGRLAESYAVSGGVIRNAAFTAAHLAAADGGVVTESHVVQALRRELDKEGRRVAGEMAA